MKNMCDKNRCERKIRIVAASDSFKGSLSSLEAGEAIRNGVLRAIPDAEVDVIPVADGGEGTAEALAEAMGGRLTGCAVRGPLGDEVIARYGISGDGQTAIMEMAQASGITLIGGRLNPLEASTYGTGEMIKDALGRGVRTFLIGIGGSATNDGGTGLLEALGVRFLDAEGSEIRGCGGNLGKIAGIDLSGMDERAGSARFLVACDVDNPLCGENGASHVFGPQKGATPAMAERLDAGMKNYAEIAEKSTGRSNMNTPGAGAAGGLGFCFSTFFDAVLENGSELMLKAIDFKRRLSGASLVITGEGRLDAQTVRGKTPFGVLKASLQAGIPAIAIGGAVTAPRELLEAGFTAVFPVVPGPVSLAEAVDAEQARENVARTAEMIARTFFRI